MVTLIFATNNIHKVTEVSKLVGNEFRILTLKEAGIHADIAEPHDNLRANALEKALYTYRTTGFSCFSEDTGLEVEALNGEPGVRSARYAGEQKSDEQNIVKLLQKLAYCHNKNARFRTIICLIIDGQQYFFEGICSGKIIAEKRGAHGFGYDSIFIPDGAVQTFAEMTLDQKNEYSHRTKAIAQLIDFIAHTEK